MVGRDTTAAGVALVTGAGGGLGGACCEALQRSGLRVVAADIDGDAAERVREEVGGDAISSAILDVTDRAEVERLVGSIVESAGTIDVLVNLAGVIRNQVLPKIEDADFRLVMATHVEGTLNTMRAATPAMREHGY